MRALLREALRVQARILIPAAVLAQVWREGRRQAAIGMLLKGKGTEVVSLDALLAKAVGTLCGRTGTSDVVDASLVLVARRSHALVVASDADDIRRLDPALPVEAL